VVMSCQTEHGMRRRDFLDRDSGGISPVINPNGKRRTGLTWPSVERATGPASPVATLLGDAVREYLGQLPLWPPGYDPIAPPEDPSNGL